MYIIYFTMICSSWTSHMVRSSQPFLRWACACAKAAPPVKAPGPAPSAPRGACPTSSVTSRPALMGGTGGTVGMPLGSHWDTVGCHVFFWGSWTGKCVFLFFGMPGGRRDWSWSGLSPAQPWCDSCDILCNFPAERVYQTSRGVDTIHISTTYIQYMHVELIVHYTCCRWKSIKLLWLVWLSSCFKFFAHVLDDLRFRCVWASCVARFQCGFTGRALRVFGLATQWWK